MKSRPIRQYPDSRKDLSQEEKGIIGDEMFGWIIDSMDMSLSKLQEMVKDRKNWHVAVHGITESDMTERLNNKYLFKSVFSFSSDKCLGVEFLGFVVALFLIFW